MADLTGHEEVAYEVSNSTTGGFKQRACPCCKKLFKMERLGPHFKEKHPTEYNDLFTVARLTSAIQEKKLVAFTVETEERNIDYLHCFACCSVRTTDRNHFKDKDTHLAEHLELAEKLIAKKTGVAFMPVNTTEIEKLKRKYINIEREYAHFRKDCNDEHGQFEAHNTVNTKKITDLEERVAELEKKLDEEKAYSTTRGKRVEHLETAIKVCSLGCKAILKDMDGLITADNQSTHKSCMCKIGILQNTLSQCVGSL